MFSILFVSITIPVGRWPNPVVDALVSTAHVQGGRHHQEELETVLRDAGTTDDKGSKWNTNEGTKELENWNPKNVIKKVDLSNSRT